MPHKGETQEKEILKEIRIFKQRSKEGGGDAARNSQDPLRRVTARKQKHPSVANTAEIKQDNDPEEPIDQAVRKSRQRY